MHDLILGLRPCATEKQLALNLKAFLVSTIFQTFCTFSAIFGPSSSACRSRWRPAHVTILYCLARPSVILTMFVTPESYKHLYLERWSHTKSVSRGNRKPGANFLRQAEDVYQADELWFENSNMWGVLGQRCSWRCFSGMSSAFVILRCQHGMSGWITSRMF